MIAVNYNCSKHCSFISIAFQTRKVKLLPLSEGVGGNAMALSVESSDNKVFMDALFRVSQSIPAGIVLI